MVANDKIHDLGLSTKQKCISALVVVYVLFNWKWYLTRNESQHRMEEPTANKDVIAAKLSSNAGIPSRDPSAPQKYLLLLPHLLSALPHCGSWLWTSEVLKHPIHMGVNE